MLIASLILIHAYSSAGFQVSYQNLLALLNGDCSRVSQLMVILVQNKLILMRFCCFLFSHNYNVGDLDKLFMNDVKGLGFAY